MGIFDSDTREAAMSNPGHSPLLLITLTAITMLAFAANSLLTRMAFQTTSIDPALFTFTRIAAGAVTLAAILQLRGRGVSLTKSGYLSAVLLFIYVAAFSFAYRSISTGAGALVLFASAQSLMIAYGYYIGEKTNLAGLLLAIGGLIVFLAPSAFSPPLASVALMGLAGMAWGGFSLLGRATDSPMDGTASSFIWALPLTMILLLFQRSSISVDSVGVIYAVLSGSLASAIGYVIWYWVRVRMTAISAGSVQLSVPVLSAMLGMIILGEQMSVRSVFSAAAVLLGVALTTLSAKSR